LRVEVIGHQWWWEYRYPTLNISAYNELHIPVGTPVQLDMTSADVIHSFWVPRLGGKRDLIQGRTNRIAFRADSTGEYSGQCAEFCGVSHANMRLRVFVQSDSVFQRWLDQQRACDEAGGADDAAESVAAGPGCLDRISPEPEMKTWLTTTDHKRIGLLYFWTAFGFFLIGGLEALIIRAQLARPDGGLGV